ncbi:MAG TPA: MraY family glycosyltransferase [Terriglobales bacterium]|nr:MraY family glycosyltransferase [Terriglobales bacterium]
MTIFYLGAFAAALLLSFVGTWFVREFAKGHGWVCGPAHDRHLHSAPLPRLGGVAIFLAFLLSFGTELLLALRTPGIDFGAGPRSLATILVPGFVVFLLGVYDDIYTVGPYTKFFVQAIAAAMLFAGGLRIFDLPVLFPSHQFSGFVSLALTILWVLAITNAFNLIDGLDGLAAGSALFSTMVVFVVALLSGASLVALMTLALAGAILGFLRYNFNPATIFLGDCGSLFIGFMLSALALQGAQKAPTIIAVAIPVVSFGLPILETALSILRRFISGRPVFTADREHIHHKLLQLGLSHRQVVITLYAVSAFFALISLFLLWPTGSSLGLVLAVLGTGIWLGVQHLGYLEFGELRRVAQRTIEQRQIVINNLAIRRATEELKVTTSYSQVLRILKAAFGTNDFDAFDLSIDFLPTDITACEDLLCIDDPECGGFYRWKKTGSHFAREMVSAWSIKLDLFTAQNRRSGSLTIYRLYTTRELQLDVNLLTSVFPVALADALDRCRVPSLELLSPPVEAALAARAG